MTPLARLAVAAALLASSAMPGMAEPITGAGSSFAFPVIGKWAQNYRVAKSDGAEMTPFDIGVDYEPIGSLGGEVRVTQRATDFGASDRPLSAEELQRSALIQFPIVMGGYAVFYAVWLPFAWGWGGAAALAAVVCAAAFLVVRGVAQIRHAAAFPNEPTPEIEQVKSSAVDRDKPRAEKRVRRDVRAG